MSPKARSLRFLLLASLFFCGLMAVSRADTSGMPLATQDIAQLSGGQVYDHLCQACHMAGGRGAVGAGHYPQLAGDPALKSWQFAALTVIGGRNGMPGFGLPPMEAMQLLNPSLSDAQIAAVVNYIRSHFGNHFKDTVTPAQVAALRAKAHP
jgi:mono/diheme cytochrome c family protein